jgi:TRAP transporter 4TM/12TM fusion protein
MAMSNTISLDKLLSIDSAISVLSVISWILVMSYAALFIFHPVRLTYVFIGLMTIIYCLNELQTHEGWKDILPLITSMAITTGVTVYFTYYFNAIYSLRNGYALQREYIMTAIFTLVIIYLTWRAFGAIFLLLFSGTILYARFGTLIPGFFGHVGMAWEFIAQVVLAEGDTGIYGSISVVVARWLALFALFAGLLKGYGGFEVIIEASLRVARAVKSKAGIPQTAVISSAFIGSINGSRTANAALTGSITIPLMKESGMDGETAAGIESVASSLGQILPPVMGTAAFVMANFLGVSYSKIILVGALPAIILVLAVSLSTYYAAVRNYDTLDVSEGMWESLESKGREDVNWTLATIRYGLPVVALVYILGVLQFTVSTAGLSAVAVMMATGIFTPILFGIREGRSMKEMTSRAASETMDGFREGALLIAPIVLIVATINGVVDILIATGVPSSLTLSLMAITGGVLISTALMSMFIAVVLGMSLPTVAAYILMAILVAPTITENFTIAAISVHYFVLYATVIAGVTPPVASACAVTSGIAQCGFLGTCKEAVRIAAPMFIMPFSFLFKPQFLAELGAPSFFAAGAVLLGSILLVHGLNYRHRKGIIGSLGWGGIFTILGVVAMAHPNMIVSYASAALGLILLDIQTSAVRSGVSWATNRGNLSS